MQIHFLPQKALLHCKSRALADGAFQGRTQVPNRRTEELFASTTLLNDLDKPRFQLFNRRNMVGKNSHFTRLGWNVDLYTEEIKVSDAILRLGAKSVELEDIHIGGFVN